MSQMNAVMKPEPAAATTTRWLKPENTCIYQSHFSVLHCVVQGQGVYNGVFAVRLFPASYPDNYISLNYTEPDDGTREIGILENLNQFPEDARRLVCSSLERHYYEQVIVRIHSIRHRYGLLFFDVQTQRGTEQFITLWQHDRARDYGKNGKAILDIDDNRFVIPDLSALPAPDRRRLVQYIYW